MGVSVSASFAFVALGVFLTLGLVHTAATNSYERVADAQDEAREDFVATQETAIAVTSAEVTNSIDCTVRVNVTNEGETTLTLDDTDVLVNGRYQADWQADATVAGNKSTGMWLPGERLSLNVTDAPIPPNRTKVVTQPGVADAARIEGGSRC